MQSEYEAHMKFFADVICKNTGLFLRPVFAGGLFDNAQVG